MGRLVLVVDDDRDIRESLIETLEDHGYAAIGAGNGVEAIDVLRTHPARPCLILLDLMMPVMNGWEFREAQRRQPDLASIPVVVVSAAGPRAEIPAIPADGWLSKPVDFDALLATIRPFCRPPAAS